MPDTGATGTTGKPTISNKSDAVPKTESHQCCSRGEHFAHTGSALGAFISDHHNIPGDDFISHQGLHGIFFGTKTPSRPFKHHHLLRNSGLLNYSSIRCKVPAEN